MRFTTEHHFPGTPQRVAALMVDPTFETTVDLPDLSTPEVLEHSEAPDATTLQLRYEYIGELDGHATRNPAGRQLTLVQTGARAGDPATGTFTLVAEADPGRVHGSATIRITSNGAESVRRFEGEFVVKVPLMGGTIEKRLLPGILSRFDVEAAALADHLGASGEPPT
jgi:hypothetical protein